MLSTARRPIGEPKESPILGRSAPDAHDHLRPARGVTGRRPTSAPAARSSPTKNRHPVVASSATSSCVQSNRPRNRRTPARSAGRTRARLTSPLTRSIQSAGDLRPTWSIPIPITIDIHSSPSFVANTSRIQPLTHRIRWSAWSVPSGQQSGRAAATAHALPVLFDTKARFATKAPATFTDRLTRRPGRNPDMTSFGSASARSELCIQRVPRVRPRRRRLLHSLSTNPPTAEAVDAAGSE